MSNCPQNTMKDWFAALFRPLTLLGEHVNRKPVSRGWNKDVLSAGREGKLPIYPQSIRLEKWRGKNRENCGYWEERAVYTNLNAVTIYRGLWTSMNIKPLTSTRAREVNRARQGSFAFFAWEQCSKARWACFYSIIPALITPHRKINIARTTWIRNAWEKMFKQLPDRMT